MYNLRYHIVTVTAIFVALAVGLLLGVALGRSDAAQTTTDSLVDGLRDSLDALQADRDALQGELATSEQLNETLAGAWVQGRLAGQHALVLGDVGDGACVTQVTNLLVEAGASVKTVSLRLPAEGEDAYEELRAGLADTDVLAEVPQGRDELAEALGEALAQEWDAAQEALPAGEEQDAAGVGAQASSALADAGVAGTSGAAVGASAAGEKVGGSDGSAPAGGTVGDTAGDDAFPLTALLRARGVLVTSATNGQLAGSTVVVDAASEGGGAEPTSLALTASLAQLGVSTASTQLADAEGTLVQDAWARGVSGMAGVEEPAGAYGLVALLCGATPGAYGVDGASTWPSVPGEGAEGAARGSHSGDADATAASSGADARATGAAGLVGSSVGGASGVGASADAGGDAGQGA